MKVGDYVRFKTLSRETKIGKIINIYDGNIPTYDLDNQDVTANGYIIKSSSNIIDLIEVGDYVNGHYVFDKINGAIYIEDYTNKMAHIPYTKGNIKSVLTKEQFSSKEYKVGDDKE